MRRKRYWKPGCMSSLLWPSAVNTAIWPDSTLSSREVSQVTLEMPEANLAMGIFYQKDRYLFCFPESQSNICDAYTLSDVFILVGATEVAVLCLQMLPEHKTNGVSMGCNKPCLSTSLWELATAEESNKGFSFFKRFISHMHPPFHQGWSILLRCLGNYNFL